MASKLPSIRMNDDLVDSARIAWNRLSFLLDDAESYYTEEESDTFRRFYRGMIESLLKNDEIMD